MTPARAGLIAAAALAPAVAYELAEVRKGDDGWPYSRFVRLLPRPVIVVGLLAANRWLWPHWLRRAVADIDNAISNAFDIEEFP